MAPDAGRDGMKTVLLIDAPGTGWEPARGGRALETAAALRDLGIHPIVAALAPGQGGIWTDVVDDLEVIRLGFPDPPRPRAFDPCDPLPLPENLFIRHWERIVYGRSVRIVLTWTGRVAGPLRMGLSGLDVRWWGIAADWVDWTRLAPTPKRAPRGEPARIERLLILPTAGERPASASFAPDNPSVEILDRDDGLAPRILRGLESIS